MSVGLRSRLYVGYASYDDDRTQHAPCLDFLQDIDPRTTSQNNVRENQVEVDTHDCREKGVKGIPDALFIVDDQNLLTHLTVSSVGIIHGFPVLDHR